MEAHPVNGTGFGIVHLRAAGVSVVLDCRGPSLPEVLHWGADLGELDGTFLGAAVVAATPPLASGSLDAPYRVASYPSIPVAGSGCLVSAGTEPARTGRRDSGSGP